ncbi:uncharacterized protein CIMG_08750 [Coccidioides immitis RS]|uniref:Uncharacterized protein n=1 Tax=Coccidioides immitis (strain RS) TaxID=246410 RepID=J3K645_COCIM|nr:uncharacterized protein CIMG_08750 [Coccidioides immitis RS]EAS30004.3 hypothetical protein CIMG_08750 [Coccidioides immitis RS]
MAPLSIDGALSALADASRAIQRRKGVTDYQEKRIKEAVDLLRSGKPSDTKGAKRRTTYLTFLERVMEENGPPMVILCVVGLGLSVIAIAKEDVLLDLPYVIKDRPGLRHVVLDRLADQYLDFYSSRVEQSHTPIITGSQPSNICSPMNQQNPSETHAAERAAVQPTHHEQFSIPPARRVDFRCSAARVSEIPQIGSLLFGAIQNSNQWIWERTVGGNERETTDCLNVLVPEDRNQDISITLVVGHEKGLELIEKLKLASISRVL